MTQIAYFHHNYWFVWFVFMVFNASFNNISVISWRLALLVEETVGSGENHWPVAIHWQTLSHNHDNVVHLENHTIMATTASKINIEIRTSGNVGILTFSTIWSGELAPTMTQDTLSCSNHAREAFAMVTLALWHISFILVMAYKKKKRTNKTF